MILQSSTRILSEPCGRSYGDLRALNDELVMAHLAAGHGDAVAVLLERYGRLVLRIAVKTLHDEGEAEDLAQEVFVDLCRTAARFDPAKGTVKMWIVRAATRRALNRRRHLLIRNFYSPSCIEEESEMFGDSRESTASSLTIPDARRLVSQMLGMIEASQRRVLELVFFEGLTLKDVAERTGQSLDSVRHRYYRGLLKMRRILKPAPAPMPDTAAGETINV